MGLCQEFPLLSRSNLSWFVIRIWPNFWRNLTSRSFSSPSFLCRTTLTSCWSIFLQATVVRPAACGFVLHREAFLLFFFVFFSESFSSSASSSFSLVLDLLLIVCLFCCSCGCGYCYCMLLWLAVLRLFKLLTLHRRGPFWKTTTAGVFCERLVSAISRSRTWTGGFVVGMGEASWWLCSTMVHLTGT